MRTAARSNRRTTDLTERAKELRCLIAVSRVLSDRRSPIANVFERLVDEIPRGWRYPELASVRLTWKDQQWTAPGFCVTPWILARPIGDSREPVGMIEVAYKARPESSPPFLPEESRLLEAIADRVTDVIELDAYRDQLRSLASQLAITEERQRRDIATYLHDRIGQELALIKLRLESVRGCAREDEHNRVIDQVCELSAEIIRRTRTLTFEISPPILHELGLAPAIEWLADTMQSQHGLTVSVVADPVPVLEEDLSALVFRSTNELLNNVVRHACARSAAVRVRTSGPWLRVEVEDDGCGFVPDHVAQAGAFGLFSIRERLTYVGGRLELRSAPDQGTRATIVAPLARKHAS
jgi:signal transduction histidine kinase